MSHEFNPCKQLRDALKDTVRFAYALCDFDRKTADLAATWPDLVLGGCLCGLHWLVARGCKIKQKLF